MKRQIITTKDGSKTIFIPEWNEQYHSTHGAIQESQHVFLKNGLHYFLSENNPENIAILEIGFGTGLNALLTLLESEKFHLQITYQGVEKFPVSFEEIEKLNYDEQLGISTSASIFYKLHTSPWEEEYLVSNHFQLKKQQKDFSEIKDENTFDIIYFDAFGARVQPELWTETIFKAMYKALKTGGVLVTYSAKGSVKRAMRSVGFAVSRLEGPPGKRHMLRAIKLD